VHRVVAPERPRAELPGRRAGQDGKAMFSCKDVTERASDELDGRLTARERIGLQAHLAICVHCRRYLRQFARTVGLLRALPAEAPAEPSPVLLKAFRDAAARKDGG
jgi:predicted anti-sigma-YlaC factor YlaD